ncbi:TIR domain-containing protein [Marinomonas polaris DSM 16579]|uniref:TIR domain-containing protein n=1 Tax=Marinomonas polaris DSM 16579 TaxID=1122206 RepID=A0A1M4T0B6_9GAMM|nr:toll/interleukin-1 receptor domain-containing protein [Marinomonas polaris]SHE37921.1 TIR domain-containing protein [Marinomonas polaris DSM 16579]
MSQEKSIRIYIDNFVGDDGEAFATTLKEKLAGLKIDSMYETFSFTDLGEGNEADPNNEANTISAINNSDIVIPIVTTSFISYVTPRIEYAYNSIIGSKNRYFFPVLLKATDWSSHEWLVRSQLIPRDATPLYEHSDNEQENSINELIKSVKTSIVRLSKEFHEDVEKPAAQGNGKGLVFISHDHDDADFAELLKLRLEKEGIESWIDTERLKIGQDWREEIDQGIKDSVAVIAIMTPEARKSEYVTYEWAFAWGKGKKIFPLMLKQTQLHPRLESLQYLNFTNNPTRPWEELISSIREVIN